MVPPAHLLDGATNLHKSAIVQVCGVAPEIAMLRALQEVRLALPGTRLLVAADGGGGTAGGLVGGRGPLSRLLLVARLERAGVF